MGEVVDDRSLSVIWSPQKGPQSAFVTCPVYENFFGGARGGGKTDAVLGDWGIHSDKYGPDAIGLMIRRTRVELLETIERARRIFSPLGATFTSTPARVTMPGGGRLSFAYLERDSDAEGYQGHSYTRVYVEEAGNFPSPAPILKLHATLRSGAGVPVGMRLTGNPGGPGHQWVRARYIDPAPLGWQVIKDEHSGLERMYIPSRVADNTFLGSDYVSQIKASGSPQLVKAWLEGDWSIIAGAFFPEWSTDKHILAPQPLPEHWTRFRAADWGSARPFSVGWYAVSDGELPHIQRGALVRYREWYGMKPGQPNEGLRLTAAEVAQGIKERERGDRIAYGVIDPAAFAVDGGPSIAEIMGREGVHWRAADNKRVAQRGAMGGWDQVRARLKGDGERPGLFVFSTCVDLIRTLPALQHDEHKPEDVNTESEDHACFAAGTIVDGLGAIETVGQLTRCDTELVRVKYADGRVVDCTPDHRFLGADSVWHRADQMMGRLSWCPTPSKSSQAFDITAAAFIFSARVCDFIALCGNAATGLSRTAGMSTTRTEIAPTTRLPTSNYSAPLTTCPTTEAVAIASLPRFARQPQSGTAVKSGANGTAPIGGSTLHQWWSAASKKLARCAGRLSRRAVSRQAARGSAISTADSARCVSVERLPGTHSVYCLPAKAGWFTVAGGIAVSNCDELRYACMSRPFVRQVETKPMPSWAFHAPGPETIQGPRFKDMIERAKRARAGD